MEKFVLWTPKICELILFVFLFGQKIKCDKILEDIKEAKFNIYRMVHIEVLLRITIYYMEIWLKSLSFNPN